MGLCLLLPALSATLPLGPGVASACEFIVLAAERGHSLADHRGQASPFASFLAQQSAPPNNDGYGVAWYGPDPQLLDHQRHYATGLGTVWYRHNDGAVLDSAFAQVWRPGNQARLVLGHVRNGTGGRGSHPFVQHRARRSFAFQHNGDLSNGGSTDLKEALLHGLLQCGFFADDAYSGGNWWGDPADVDSWIDSELLFFYLLHHVEAADGDLEQGLREALAREDWYGFNVRADITRADPDVNPRSVINFALSDGETVVVYKNARDGDMAHELAWKVLGPGLAGVMTAHAEGYTALRQHELLVLPADGSPRTVANLLEEPRDAVQPASLALLSASPNPFNPMTILRVQVMEAGTYSLAVHNLRGERVAMLGAGDWAPGGHAFTWQGLDEAGAPAASGTYLAVLSGGSGSQVVKLLLVR